MVCLVGLEVQAVSLDLAKCGLDLTSWSPKILHNMQPRNNFSDKRGLTLHSLVLIPRNECIHRNLCSYNNSLIFENRECHIHTKPRRPKLMLLIMGLHDGSSCLDLVQTLSAGKKLRLAVKGLEGIVKSKMEDPPKEPAPTSTAATTAISAVWQGFKDEHGKTDEVVIDRCIYMLVLIGLYVAAPQNSRSNYPPSARNGICPFKNDGSVGASQWRIRLSPINGQR